MRTFVALVAVALASWIAAPAAAAPGAIAGNGQGSSFGFPECTHLWTLYVAGAALDDSSWTFEVFLHESPAPLCPTFPVLLTLEGPWSPDTGGCLPGEDFVFCLGAVAAPQGETSWQVCPGLPCDDLHAFVFGTANVARVP